MDAELLQAATSLAARWLFHATWQAAGLAALAALVLARLEQTAPQARYVVACVALVAMPVAPALTVVQWPWGAGLAVNAPWFSEYIRGSIAPLALAAAPWTATAVAIWLSGVVVLASRLLLSYRALARLIASSTAPMPTVWRDRALTLATRMGVRRTVVVAQSTRVEVPCVTGWLRPMILLPTSVLTGLPAPHIEAILAHELAHVRRHDMVMNVVQLMVETVLYFHPAVWWMSRIVRREREHCCDELALTVYPSRFAYARALTALEELRGATWRPALGATEGQLLSRVRRLLADQPQRRRSSVVPLGLSAIGTVAALWLVVVGSSGTSMVASPDELVIALAAPSVLALALGFGVGLRHALEPDHLATVATLVSTERSSAAAAWLGASWGLGHTAALVATGGIVLAARTTLPASITTLCEGAVAILLMVFGWRALRHAWHLASEGPARPHRHGTLTHAHAHRADHVHLGPLAFSTRPLVAGIVHGLAGSGSLIALALAELPTTASQALFLAVFSISSTLAMAALSGCAGWPLARLTGTPRFAAGASLASGMASLLLALFWSAPRLVAAL